MIDADGFRAGVAMVIVNEQNKVFWARRRGLKNAWQFPQGGMQEGETPLESMYRELYEEVGLKPHDVIVLAESQEWHPYNLPKRLIRYHSQPLCIGQKQKWFLLKLISPDTAVNFECSDKPEFSHFRWVNYWIPVKQVVAFKRRVYRAALKEFSNLLFPETENFSEEQESDE